MSNGGNGNQQAGVDQRGYTVWQPQPSQFERQEQARRGSGAAVLTVFDCGVKVLECNIAELGKSSVSFGRGVGNDIVIPSATRVVSRNHGVLSFEDGLWVIYDAGSTNGIKMNGARTARSSFVPGDVVSIGRVETPDDCVIMLLGDVGECWEGIPLDPGRPVSIGRSVDNDIVLRSPSVSSHHARISPTRNGSYVIEDLDSYNGTYVMGRALAGPQVLAPGDMVSFSLTSAVFTGSVLLCRLASAGVDVVAHNLVQIRKSKGRKRITTDHVSLHIRRGDFVAVVGGSGSGKSTLLNELNGSDPAAEGSVYIDGIELYPNYNYLKNAIGYVPQQDIVYDDLTLVDMLRYAAELRMPPDATRQERERRVDEVIELLELQGERDNYIGRMSGGQKKRASIAVELLADPRLLFLDEPTSGLDPGIERDLMRKLAAMAAEGRTIILVTHTTLNLNLCSQVVFLGAGGKLCYAGSPQGALSFFGVKDFVSIYDEVNAWADGIAEEFERTRRLDVGESVARGDRIAPKKSLSFFRQLFTLSRRYAKLVVNDKQRLLLLLAQAPVLAALICLVAGGDCFEVCESTKSCLFALSCAAFWVGILNSIQEICKERTILQREYAGGLKISAYVASKVLVLGALCVLQSAMLTGVFCAMNGAPPAEPLLLNGVFELFVTMLLLTLSAMCLGLWISALFSNPDRAIAMAPILIMPQVLFSGLIFELKGVAENISVFVNCRWAMEAFGATADLNSLDLEIYGEEVTVPAGTQHIDEAVVPVPDMTTEYRGREIEVEGSDQTITDFDVDVPEQVRTIDGDMYSHEVDHAYDHLLPHLLTDWGILAAFCVLCAVLSCITLKASMRR